MRRVVLTGGPGAGKTVVARAIESAFAGRIVVIPEAATQIYTRLNTRWDKLDLEGRRNAQRAMYRLQLEQEAAFAARYPDRVLLHDRGTIDGAAYWPEGPAAFWVDVGTTHAAELARYDAILWLETAAALGIYDGDASNAVRFEDPKAAIASGEALLTLWGDHPSVRHIGAFMNLDDKIAAVVEALRPIVEQNQK
jgi:predicted ATPase